MENEKKLPEDCMDLSTYWEYKTCPHFTHARGEGGNSCGHCAYCQIKRDYGDVGGYRGLKSAVCTHEANRGKQFFKVLTDCD